MEGIGTSRGWGSLRTKNLKESDKLDWNFQRGRGGGLRVKDPLLWGGGGMDVF